MNIFLRSALEAIALSVVAVVGVSQSQMVLAEKSLQAATFDEALRDCRMKQPGRINRRLSLRVDSPNIAACLRRSGWEVNGDMQTLVASLQPRTQSAI